MASVFETYAAFKASESYNSAIPGAGVDVVVFDPLDPTVRLVAAVTNFTANETFEKVAIQEAGQTGVTEFAHGAHSGSGSFSFNARPINLDKLPTRSTAIGKTYTIVIQVASEGQREHQGAPLEVFEGVVISTFNSQFAAGGVMTGSINFSYLRRLSGQEYATEVGL